MTNHPEPAALVEELREYLAGAPTSTEQAYRLFDHKDRILAALTNHATAIRERDEARALLRELAGVFRGYSKSHLGKVGDLSISDEERSAREQKAFTNGAYANRIDTLLSDGGEHE